METVFLDVDDRIMMCTTNKLESICQLSQLRGSLFACKLVLLHTIMCTIIIQKQKKYNRGKWKSEPRFPSGQPPSHGDAWNRHARRCPYGKWLGSPGSELGEGSAMGERVWECARGEIRRVLEEGVLLRVSHCFPVILWFTAAQLGVVCLWWWDLSCGRLSWCASALNARKIWGKRTLYYSTCTCRYLSMQLVYCYICCFHNALSFVSVFENLCFLFIFPFSSPLL